MKRLDYLQQKLPHSLHETGMLEGSEPYVCSILHTLHALPIPPCRRSLISLVVPALLSLNSQLL